MGKISQFIACTDKNWKSVKYQ